MKKINLTYHMQKGTETAENIVTLMMEDTIADEIIKTQKTGTRVGLILTVLAEIQGYEYIGLCSAEPW